MMSAGEKKEKLRLSTVIGHKHHRFDAYKFDAYLDGALIKTCHTADEEAGYIEHYELDENGNVKRNQKGEPISIKKTGNVEIIRREP